MRLRSLVISSLLVPLSALAQSTESRPSSTTPPVVVMATRVETPITQVGSSVTVIPAEEIERRGTNELQQILREVPSVDVVRSGGPGGDTAVFIRGGNSEHTLFLVDGIEMNDPVSTARSLNLSSISLDNIERIEVLRGPQGTLYGSDALGGVVNIITKKGSGDPTVGATLEGGSYDTWRSRLRSQGGFEFGGYSIGLSREDTNGVSANDNPAGDPENDAFANTSGSARLDLRPTEEIELSTFVRAHNTNGDIDDGPGAGADDPNRHFKSNRQFYRGQLSTKFFDGALKQIAGVSFSDHEFDDNNDPDDQHLGELLRSSYESSMVKFDLQNTVEVTDGVEVTVGAEVEEEKANSEFRSDGPFGPFESLFPEQSAESYAFFSQLALGELEGFSSTFGARLDHHEGFGEAVTWRIAPTYYVNSTGTRFRSSVGTGFKAPSLFQRFSEYGRPDLEEEESIGVDAGVEQTLFGETLTLGATYFYNRFDHLITFDLDTFLFENIDDATTQGVELLASVRPLESLEFGANFTLLDAENNSTNSDLLRRAKSRLNAHVSWNVCEKLKLGAQMLFVGHRPDTDFSAFPAARVTLPTYAIFNVTADYALTDQLKIFARGENIFDEDYEDVLGYNTLGAVGFVGVKFDS